MKTKKIINNPPQPQSEELKDDLVTDVGDLLPDTGEETFRDFKAPAPNGVLSAEESKKNEKEYRGVKVTIEIRKRRVLAALEASLMNVGASCHSAGISYATYYRWREDDPDFRKATDQIDLRLLNKVEDKLKELIANGKESSVHFFLKSKHPNYRPKLETNNNPDAFTGTLDDLLRQADEEADAQDALEQEEQITKEHATQDEQGNNRGAVQNQGQEGLDSIVQAQRDTEPVLGQAPSA